jgi:hypothetical protein
MAGDRDEERDREALRGYFECFKHLNLVSTLILVVVLVLYRDLYLDPVLAVLSLVAFGVAVMTSFYGMFVAMNGDLSPPGGFPGSLLRRLLYVAVGAVGGAVLFLIVSVVVVI